MATLIEAAKVFKQNTLKIDQSDKENFFIMVPVLLLALLILKEKKSIPVNPVIVRKKKCVAPS